MDLAEKTAELSDGSPPSSRAASFEELPDESSDRPQNRRSHPRFSVEGDSTLQLVSHGVSLPSRILDLSLEGCRLRTRERFAVAARARVEVTFKVNGIAFRFLGVIQWTDSRHCTGIRFVDTTARRREELAEVITEIELITAAKEAKAADERDAQSNAQAAEEALPPVASHQGTPSLPSQNFPQSEASRQCTTPPRSPSSQNPLRPEASRQCTTPTSPLSFQNPLRPASSHQGTTLLGSPNFPRPESSRQGTTSVVPQPSQNQKRASALAIAPIGAAPSQATEDPAALRAAELAEWEAREWAEIQQLEHAIVEAAPKAETTPKPAEVPASQPKPIPAPTMRDRRAQSRHPVDTSAAILLIKIGSRLAGRIIDLSASGCRILCDERFPVGIYTRVEIEFRLEGLPFRLGGVIQAIHDRHTIGIRFLDMSGRKREQIDQLIEEIDQARALLPADSEAAIESQS